MASIQTRPVRAYELKAGDTVNGVPVIAAHYTDEGFLVEFDCMTVLGSDVKFTGVVFT